MPFTETNLAATTAGRSTNAKRSKSPMNPTLSKVKKISASQKPATAPKTPAMVGKATASVSRGKGRISRSPDAAMRIRGDDGLDGANASSMRKGTKLANLIEMLRRPDGASLDELVVALGWQVHSIRGAISGALKKKLALVIETSKVEGGRRVYRIAR